MNSVDGDDADGVRAGIMLTTESVIEKTEIRNRICPDVDLKLAVIKRELEPYLPAMAETFRTTDFPYCVLSWTNLQSIGELSFEDALNQETVATCFWFLLTNKSPLDLKKALFSVLQFIVYIAPKAANMPVVAEGEGVDHTQRKMSIDQACIDTLVVDALCSGDEEIIRQVCEAIRLVLQLRLTDTVDIGIQNELVRLACSFPFSRDPLVAIPLLTSINEIISKMGDGVIMEKLVVAMLRDKKWLLNIMKEHDDHLLLELYEILECITREEYDEELWEVLVDGIIPEILKKHGGHVDRVYTLDDCLKRSAAGIISYTINGASSPDEIEDLALNTECVRSLVGFLDLFDEDEDSTRLCMEAIENILTCDDDESEDNLYASIIGKHRYTCMYGCYGEERIEIVEGWCLLDNSAPNSRSLLLKYAPYKWLLKHMEDFEDD